MRFKSTNLYSVRSLYSPSFVWTNGAKMFCRQVAKDLAVNEVGLFFDIAALRAKRSAC